MKKKQYGYICLLISMLLFSSYEVVNKTLVGKINAIEVNFIRFFLGGLVLAIFTHIKEGLKISLKEFLSVSLLGIINVVISMSLLQLSLFLPNSKASVVAVIFSSNPIFVTIFSSIIEKESIKLYKVFGLILGILGVAIIFISDLHLRDINFLSPLLVLTSAIAFSLYTVLGKKLCTNIGSLKMNSYSFIIGSLFLIPFLIIFNVPIISVSYLFSPQILYLSFLVTGLAYLTYFTGLSIVGASTGSLVFFSKPVMASILAMVYLHEKITINLFIGTIFITISILLIVFWDKLHGLLNHTSK